MSNVFKINEEAYSNRYGKSLFSVWNELSVEQQSEYIETVQENDRKSIPKEYTFGKNEILRIIIGYYNTMQLDSVLSGGTPALRILLWEPDEALFACACTLHDLSQYINDSRIIIALGREMAALELALRGSVYDCNILHRHIYPYGRYLAPDDCDVKKFIELFEKVYVDMVSKMQFRKNYDHLIYKNILYAVSVLSENSTVNQLFDNIPVRDIPVIIVAAGPSLLKNCNELKRAKGKSIIVAVAHSMKTLAQNKIKPDLVATMDPASPFFLDFDKTREYTLLSCVSGNAIFQQAYNGSQIYYGFPMFKEFFSIQRTQAEKIVELDTGSVATDILSLFAGSGFKRFILVGQDLAYGDEGISHTGGEKEIREKDTYGVFSEVEGINGGTVQTRDDWELFRQYYEKRIKNDNSLEIIDATEGGALIHGSRVMKLSDAIEKYCIEEYPVDTWISNVEKGDSEEKEYIDSWFRQLEEMNLRTEQNLDRIILTSNEITDKWRCTELWDEDFSAKCRRYDIIYHIIMEGDDSIHLREYCRADIERYIEDALIFEGDDNIEARMKRERELFILMSRRLKDMQEYVKQIRYDNI